MQPLGQCLPIIHPQRDAEMQHRHEMKTMLDEAAVGYGVVLTNADKIKASKLEKVVAATEAETREHVATYPKIHVTSAEKGMGIAAPRAALLADAGI